MVDEGMSAYLQGKHGTFHPNKTNNLAIIPKKSTMRLSSNMKIYPVKIKNENINQGSGLLQVDLLRWNPSLNVSKHNQSKKAKND